MQVNISTFPEFDAVAKEYRDIPPIVDKAADQALKEAAFKVEGWAKYYVPVDTGRLRASIYTTARKMYAVIQPSTDYAVAVHENLNAHHRTGQAKYMVAAVETLQKNNWQALTGQMLEKLHAGLYKKFHS